MTSTAGSIAGIALGVSLLGISLGVTGNIVKSTRRQLKLPARSYSSRKLRLRRAKII